VQVFAYGSLMWNPGFVPADAEPGTLRGWSRRWCVESQLHRGTRERPGVVLGLVPGGECTGMVYTIGPRDAEEVAAYLDRRELCEGGYRKAVLDVDTPKGVKKAITYVSEENQPRVDLKTIIEAGGSSGSNLDYAIRTFEALEVLVGRLSEAESGLCETSMSTLRAAAGIRGTSDNGTGRREKWPINTSRSTTDARRSVTSTAC
jgi:cation transport protein ChaC